MASLGSLPPLAVGGRRHLEHFRPFLARCLGPAAKPHLIGAPRGEKSSQVVSLSQRHRCLGQGQALKRQVYGRTPWTSRDFSLRLSKSAAQPQGLHIYKLVWRGTILRLFQWKQTPAKRGLVPPMPGWGKSKAQGEPRSRTEAVTSQPAGRLRKALHPPEVPRELLSKPFLSKA